MAKRRFPIERAPSMHFRRLQRTLEKLKVIPDPMRGRPEPLPPSSYGEVRPDRSFEQVLVLGLCVIALMFGFAYLTMCAVN